MKSPKKNCFDLNSFHPFAISFCGRSGVGKTTLIVRLIENISHAYDVGYVKHDAHSFEMDHKGKDTFRAKQAGSQMVFISNDSKGAFVNSYAAHGGGDAHGEKSFDISDSAARLLMVDCDVVFVEGYKNSLLPKILVVDVLDESDFFFRQYKKGFFEHVIAVVSVKNCLDKNLSKNDDGDIPFFFRDDVDKIEKFIFSFWQKIIDKNPLYGLVLCGGKSLRMGTEKAAINYFGKNQAQYLYDMLGNYCEKVFISCRAEQIQENYLKNLPQIEDRFLNFGPTGGILSAMNCFPKATWMVVACDLPYLDETTLKFLLASRNPFKLATCFRNTQKKWLEPLCSLYEAKSSVKLSYSLSLGKPCPRRVLSRSNVAMLKQCPSNLALENVNTPEEKGIVFHRFQQNK